MEKEEAGYEPILVRGFGYIGQGFDIGYSGIGSSIQFRVQPSAK